jgi:hypothetical protein
LYPLPVYMPKALRVFPLVTSGIYPIVCRTELVYSPYQRSLSKVASSDASPVGLASGSGSDVDSEYKNRRSERRPEEWKNGVTAILADAD